MRIFTNADEMAAAVGEVLGTSDWFVVEQDRIDTFADATDDHQWIHTDPERAKTGPFGGTIAHGFLTLSLVPVFLAENFKVEGLKMAINYGLDKVRFPAPVPAGSKIRGTTTLVDVAVDGNSAQTKTLTVVEIEGGSKPALIAEQIGRYYF
ncbi:MaoC family dehydratase [Smaragdicoccus niigatensis]|uniref:MaoC family dehydratase n=1 Tax=Smaragdicoccus niigatensis TaxID=359359 RepID=UPI00037D847A|nr:MaoC family dehydratase [Smaragdicoccus niigatensis]